MADEQQNPAKENSELRTESSELEAQNPQDSEQTKEPAQPFRLESQQPPAPQEPKRPAPKKDPEEASQSPFTVTVGLVYDGPFDLLLDLIRKQNIDIYDIPMARITAQFLEYTRHLQQTDVDAAGEFVYT